MTRRAAASRSWAAKDSTNKATAKATSTPPLRTPPANGTPLISRSTRATATASLPASTIAVAIRARTASATGAKPAQVPNTVRSRTSAGGVAMSDAVRQEPAHRRPHAPPLASSFLEFDLGAEVEQLHREETWKRGRNTRTLMKYDDLRVVLTALQSGKCVPVHKTEGRVSVHMLSGHIRLGAFGRTFDMLPGSLLTLDPGAPHDIEALAESSYVLTIAWPGRHRANIDAT
jgi:quercetin dioxygenase-like cupin family protein